MSLTIQQAQTLITRCAPVVKLFPYTQYSSPPYMPCSVDWYLNQVVLHDLKNGTTYQAPAGSTFDQTKLPTKGPDDEKPGKKKPLSYLQIPDPNATSPVRNGNLSSAVPYVNIYAVPGVPDVYDLQYWLFYAIRGLSTLRIRGLSDTQCDLTAYSGSPYQGIGEHQGDWKHVTVRVNLQGQIFGVYYAQHNGGFWASPGQFTTNSKGQPIVYSARNTHSCFPTAGRFDQMGTVYRLKVATFSLLEWTADGGAEWDCSQNPQIIGTNISDLKINRPIWITYWGQWGVTQTQYKSISTFVKIIVSALKAAPWLGALLFLWYWFPAQFAAFLAMFLPKTQDGPNTPAMQNSWNIGDDGVRQKRQGQDFGDLADGRPIWTDNFSGTGCAEVLFYYPGDGNWWLGSYSGTQFTWALVGNTNNFGQVDDGRPIWTGDFNGDGQAEVLFYYPGDGNWWLGSYQATSGQLVWSLAGNTAGFGNVADGRPIWISNFSNTAQAQVFFYSPGDGNWWLGSYDGTQLVWSLVGNTNNFGQLDDGRPIWTGDFNGDGQAEVLFYYPSDGNWWLGSYQGTNGQLAWSLAGNTNGFGNLAQGGPIWIGNFSCADRAEVLFYSPGDGNWRLGSYDGTQLVWTLAGNTNNFGQLDDGRPIWTGDFNGDGQAEVLFYYPDDGNWWLGSYQATSGQLAWSLAGNTNNLGQVWDGRPIWTGDFSQANRAEVLFYYPSDGNWWLGSYNGTQLAWSLAGNTGGS